MDKVKVSNTVNRALGGKELLFCTRVYVQSKLWGGFWIWIKVALNLVFQITRKESDHCRASFLWEKRHGKAKNKTDQVRSKEAEGTQTGHEASQTTGEK